MRRNNAANMPARNLRSRNAAVPTFAELGRQLLQAERRRRPAPRHTLFHFQPNDVIPIDYSISGPAPLHHLWELARFPPAHAIDITAGFDDDPAEYDDILSEPGERVKFGNGADRAGLRKVFMAGYHIGLLSLERAVQFSVRFGNERRRTMAFGGRAVRLGLNNFGSGTVEIIKELVRIVYHAVLRLNHYDDPDEDIDDFNNMNIKVDYLPRDGVGRSWDEGMKKKFIENHFETLPLLIPNNPSGKGKSNGCLHLAVMLVMSGYQPRDMMNGVRPQAIVAKWREQGREEELVQMASVFPDEADDDDQERELEKIATILKKEIIKYVLELDSNWGVRDPTTYGAMYRQPIPPSDHGKKRPSAQRAKEIELASPIRVVMVKDPASGKCHYCGIPGGVWGWKKFVRQLRKIRLGNFTCKQCERVFVTQKALRRHTCADKMVYHPFALTYDGMSKEEDDGFVCNKCGLYFNHNEAEYEYHKANCICARYGGLRKQYFVECAPKSKQVIMRVQKKFVEKATGKEFVKDDFCDEPLDYHIVYADFESYLVPLHDEQQTKLHKHLMWGVWDDKTKKYYSGTLEIKHFLDTLWQIAEENGDKKLIVVFHNGGNYDFNFIVQELVKKENTRKGYEIDSINKGPFSMLQLEVNKTEIEEYIPESRKGGKMKESDDFMDMEAEEAEEDEDGDDDKEKEGKKKYRRKYGAQLIFKDSFNYVQFSLAAIIGTIAGKTGPTPEIFPNTYMAMEQKYGAGHDYTRVVKKNPCNYDFFDCPESLDRPVEEFAASFTDDKDKEHVLEVAKDFGFRTAGEYYNLYLLADCTTLADCMNAFRETFIKLARVDMWSCVGAPSLTWKAYHQQMEHGVELHTFTDTNMYAMIRRGTRGGVTSVPLRYAESDDTHSIWYLDVNGLYPTAMVRRLPCGELTWADAKCKTEDDLWRVFAEYERDWRGAFFEVDLHYPEEVARFTDDYPLAPEFTELYLNDLESPEYDCLKGVRTECNGVDPAHCTVKEKLVFEGLVGTTRDKEHYVLYWRALEYYMKKGLRVTKIHHIIEFDEKEHMKEYISRNVERRNKETSAVNKQVLKILNNSLYGKTFENPLNRTAATLVRTPQELKEMWREGTVDYVERLEDETPKKTTSSASDYVEGDTPCLVHTCKDKVVLDKPAYIGPVITDYAKLIMYENFYDYLVKNVGRDKVQLLYTDTDSMIVRVEHPSISKEGIDPYEWLDKTCPGMIHQSEGGKFKSETGKTRIKYFCGLRSKCYSFIPDTEYTDVEAAKKYTSDEMKEWSKAMMSKVWGFSTLHAKGVAKATQAQLCFADLEECMRTHQKEIRSNWRICKDSKRGGLNVYDAVVEKICLSCGDCKRIIMGDGIRTCAVGSEKYLCPPAIPRSPPIQRVGSMGEFRDDVMELAGKERQSQQWRMEELLLEIDDIIESENEPPKSFPPKKNLSTFSFK